MATLERINAACIRISLFFAGLSLVALVVLTTVNVGMRLVAQSMYGVVELVCWFGVCINALGLAYAQERKENVAVTIFTDARSARVKVVLDIVGLVIGLAFTLLAVWGLYRYIGILIRTNQVSSSLHLPFWPIVAIIPIGLALFVVTLTTDILRNIYKFRQAGAVSFSAPTAMDEG